MGMMGVTLLWLWWAWGGGGGGVAMNWSPELLLSLCWPPLFFGLLHLFIKCFKMLDLGLWHFLWLWAVMSLSVLPEEELGLHKGCNPYHFFHMTISMLFVDLHAYIPLRGDRPSTITIVQWLFNSICLVLERFPPTLYFIIRRRDFKWFTTTRRSGSWSGRVSTFSPTAHCTAGGSICSIVRFRTTSTSRRWTHPRRKWVVGIEEKV